MTSNATYPAQAAKPLHERVAILEERLEAVERRLRAADDRAPEPEGWGQPALAPDADAAVDWLVQYKANID